MGSICMQETRQSAEQKVFSQISKVQEKDDASNQDWYSDDTDFTVSKQFQIGVINPSLIYDYQELEKNKNQIECFLKSLGSERILKTSSQLDEQILKTISKAPHTNQFVQMVHIAYYGHFPLRFSPDNIQLLTEYNFFSFNFYLIISLTCNYQQIKDRDQINFAISIKFLLNTQIIMLKNLEKNLFHIKVKRNLWYNLNKSQIIRVDHLDVDIVIKNNFTLDMIGLILSNNSRNKSKKILVKKSKVKVTIILYQLCVQLPNYNYLYITKTCYEISLMDAMQSYFTYIMGYGCGISKIKLLGTLEDWIKLRENVEKLREFELDNWIDKLGPILDQFIRLYKGDIDKEFWGDIYRYQPEGVYSNQKEYATGWITSFFPLSLDSRQQNKMEKNSYPKVDPNSLGTGLTQAPVSLIDLETGQKLMDLQFCAGFFGVGLDEDGFLYPYQGWAIKEKEKEKEYW